MFTAFWSFHLHLFVGFTAGDVANAMGYTRGLILIGLAGIRYCRRGAGGGVLGTLCLWN